MAKTYEELLEQAAIIRDETAAGKNTATRVGGTITDAVDYVKELQDTYKGIHAEAAEAKTTANAAKQTAAEAKTNAGSARSVAQSALLNANAAQSTANAASGTANEAKKESAQAVSTAQAAQTKNAEQDNRLANAEEQNTKQNERLLNYVYPKLYQINEGAGARPFDGMYSGSASVFDGRKTVAEDGCTYKVVFASGKFLLLEINQDGEDAGLYEAWDKIISGRGSSEHYTRRDCLYYIYEECEGSTYYYIESNGKASEQSATYLLRRLVDKNASSIAAASGTSNEAKETADAAKATADAAQAAAETAQTTAAALLRDTPWAGHHMNEFTETGEYHIHGESTDANDGLPILNSGTIDARLTVLDSSLTNGTGEKTDTVVTQILRLSNRMGGDGHVYVRTAQAATKSQLATPSSTAWGTWEKLMGIFEKNAVKNIADLDTYTTNGMYSGLFANTTLQTLGGLQFTPGDTFLIVTVNGYAASPFGTPQLTQMLYKLPSKKGSGSNSARMYMRTAYWDQNAEPKAWVWANWDRLAMASEISGGGGGSIEEFNRLNELIAANTTKISSVESTANDAKSAAETAQTAATSAQETANSARETATAASTAAQEAKSAAETAQATATAASAAAADAKQAAENEATARTEADTELQSQINGKQDNIGSSSADEKAALLVSLGLGKIGVVSQKQTWNDVGVEPAYVMSEKVEGFISKDNIDSLISYGFAFNEGTGYFELNGLTDISLQEALNIVAAGKPNFSLCDLHYAHKNIRTNLPIFDNKQYNQGYFGAGMANRIRIGAMAMFSDIEVFVYGQYKYDNKYTQTGFKYSTIEQSGTAFRNCLKLEKAFIIPGSSNRFYNTFLNCRRLKELELVFLKCDVDLSGSPYLSANSTHIMIANADNSNAITITLHPDAKARWEASEYYEEDSQTIISKNITIA